MAGVLLRSGEELTLPTMFHIQQMLEKLLKALILSQGNHFERTHDLSRLAIDAKAQRVEGLLELSETLNLFAVNGRYPGDLPSPNPSAIRYQSEAHPPSERSESGSYMNS